MSNKNYKSLAEKNEKAVKELRKTKLSVEQIKKVCKKNQANPKTVGKILGLKTYRNGKYEDQLK